MDSNTRPAVCARCGAGIPADSPAGWCPRCALTEFLAGGPSGEDFGPLTLQDIPQPGASVAVIGDYELLELIAHGGMGVVYKARQRGLTRIVALKMLLGGTHASDAFKRRFKIEAETVARLQHPNIVPIYEVGLHDGQPYFSMEYVEGSDLGQMVRTQPLSPKAAARYVMTVAVAVHYAHQRGVIHRDLKPSNILVGLDDRPRITDFGLAREEGKDSHLTLSGQALGTPGYLPPEQAGGKSGDIGPASDVYSLGALLYHLLTGRPPFLAGTVADTLRQVLETEALSPEQLNPAVPKDLATICLKCLEKSPGRRYASAQALAEDLERWLDGRPILARATTNSERVVLWARRYPALAGLAASLVVLLATVIIMPSVFALKLAGERRKTETERDRARSNELAQVQQRLRAEDEKRLTQRANVRYQMQRAEDYFLLGDSASGLSQLSRIIRDHPANRAAAERLVSALSSRNFALPVIPPVYHAKEIHVARFSPNGETFATASLDKTARLWNASTGEPVGEKLLHGGPVWDVRFSPDGRWLATVSDDRMLRVWNAVSAQLAWRQTNLESNVKIVRFSPDSRLLASCSENGPARLWRTDDGTEKTGRLRQFRDVNSLEFHPSGRRIALSLRRSAVLIVDLETEGVVTKSYPGLVGYVEFNADGSRLLGFNADEGLHVWNAESGKLLFPPLLLPPGIESACFSPDGTKILTASRDQSARIWDAETGAPLTGRMMHQGIIRQAVFSPDGLRVATAGREWDFTLRVWDAHSGQPLTELNPQEHLLWSVQFSPDGNRLLTASRDDTARIWDIRSGVQHPMDLRHDAGVTKATFDRGGNRVATASRHGSVSLWSVTNGTIIRQMIEHQGQANDVRFSPDGRLLASCGFDHWIKLAEASGSQVGTNLFFLPKEPEQVCFSPDGKNVAAITTHPQSPTWTLDPTTQIPTALPDGAGFSGTPVEIHEVLTGRLLAQYRHRSSGNSVAFSPNGEFLASSAWDGTAQVHNATNGALVRSLKHTDGNVNSVAFSPRGDRILTTIGHGSAPFARLWDLRTGQRVGKPMGHKFGINGAEFSADGRLIATASTDKRARIWDAATGEMRVELVGHKSSIGSARFSPDGARVITASLDGTTRAWDVQTGEPLTEILPHPGPAFGAEFSPDGRTFLAFGMRSEPRPTDVTVRLWEIPVLKAPIPAWLAELAEAVAQQRLDEKGTPQPVGASNFFQIKAQIIRSTNTDSLTRWAKWFFADRGQRGISAHATFAVPEFVGRRVAEGTLESLRAAVHLAPTNPDALRKLADALARQPAETNPHKDAEADYLRRRADALPVLQPNQGGW